jgi:spore maturation protein CgeB
VKSLNLVVLGLSLSSSWGNGHATTYRALLKAFAKRGHNILFLERDRPWYAASRDLPDPSFCKLNFYQDLEALAEYRETIAAADAVIVGSYVPDGVAVGRWVRDLREGVTAFYDIDTPVTLGKLERGDYEYLSPDLIPAYDLYLSFTGGPTLRLLEHRYRSPGARALYCTVDEATHRPLDVAPTYDLGYLGTYSADRQPGLERLLIEPARRAPELKFVVAGPQYPDNVSWPDNVTRVEHVGPVDHAAFYASCRFALNITRADMMRAGYSPSVRLFEAAACGATMISDRWRGVEEVFAPDDEILLADDADAVLGLLSMDETERVAIGRRARLRTLAEHVAARRAEQLQAYLLHAMAERRLAAAAP